MLRGVAPFDVTSSVTKKNIFLNQCHKTFFRVTDENVKKLDRTPLANLTSVAKSLRVRPTLLVRLGEVRLG